MIFTNLQSYAIEIELSLFLRLSAQLYNATLLRKSASMLLPLELQFTIKWNLNPFSTNVFQVFFVAFKKMSFFSQFSSKWHKQHIKWKIKAVFVFWLGWWLKLVLIMWRNLAPKNWGGPNGPPIGTERVKKQNIHIQIDVTQYTVIQKMVSLFAILWSKPMGIPDSIS